MKSKKHRLSPERYIGEINLAITARLLEPRDGFADANLVTEFVEALKAHASEFLCRVPVYCFMPDQLHLIVQGSTPGSRTKDAVDRFKLTTSLWLAKNQPTIHWQRSYYDHIIRGTEDWRDQARYIYRNPVRAGIVDDPAIYPFTGSIGYEFGDVIDGLSWM